MVITKEDADLLEAIALEFGENLKRNYQGDAVKAFERAAKWYELPGLVKAKMTAEFNRTAAPERRARTIADLCNKALPVLKRAFGEEFLVRAMPPAARNERIVDLCREAGSPEVADICLKAMNRSPS